MSDDIKNLEARVARLEGALTQKAGLQFGPITDPAGPWGGGWGGYRYPVHWPIGDPAPVDYSRIYADPPPFPVWGGGWGGYRPPWHGPIPDPAPPPPSVASEAP